MICILSTDYSVLAGVTSTWLRGLRPSSLSLRRSPTVLPDLVDVSVINGNMEEGPGEDEGENPVTNQSVDLGEVGEGQVLGEDLGEDFDYNDNNST